MEGGGVEETLFFYRNTTQTAVINIFKIGILLNLTFRMFVHIHFQKCNRYGFLLFYVFIFSEKVGGGGGQSPSIPPCPAVPVLAKWKACSQAWPKHGHSPFTIPKLKV